MKGERKEDDCTGCALRKEGQDYPSLLWSLKSNSFLFFKLNFVFYSAVETVNNAMIVSVTDDETIPSLTESSSLCAMQHS